MAIETKEQLDAKNGYFSSIRSAMIASELINKDDSIEDTKKIIDKIIRLILHEDKDENSEQDLVDRLLQLQLLNPLTLVNTSDVNSTYPLTMGYARESLVYVLDNIIVQQAFDLKIITEDELKKLQDVEVSIKQDQEIDNSSQKTVETNIAQILSRIAEHLGWSKEATLNKVLKMKGACDTHETFDTQVIAQIAEKLCIEICNMIKVDPKDLGSDNDIMKHLEEYKNFLPIAELMYQSPQYSNDLQGLSKMIKDNLITKDIVAEHCNKHVDNVCTENRKHYEQYLAKDIISLETLYLDSIIDYLKLLHEEEVGLEARPGLEVQSNFEESPVIEEKEEGAESHKKTSTQDMHSKTETSSVPSTMLSNQRAQYNKYKIAGTIATIFSFAMLLIVLPPFVIKKESIPSANIIIAISTVVGILCGVTALGFLYAAYNSQIKIESSPTAVQGSCLHA